MADPRQAPPQDRTYLDAEANAFFERNFADARPELLREPKRRIALALDEAGVAPRRVLEYGCSYGDLLHHFAGRGAECVGVEPSSKAVAFGRESYGRSIRLEEGTLADNPVNRDADSRGRFDLVIVDDVLCWVSRETLLRSLANIDDALADGGFLFIREFRPLQDSRNRNHHVRDAEVWCYKPAAPHSRVFTAIGTYAVVWEKTWMDHGDAWVRQGGRDAFESRWSDSVLRKSLADYYRAPAGSGPSAGP